MPVNERFWRSWPVAPRETRFNADDAIARIMQWAGGSASKFNSAFLYRMDNGQPTNPESYRLPVADIIGNRLTLIPRAVFSAAVILSGGHGGLEGVVNEADRDKLKNVLNQIYAELQGEYQDPRVRPPWLLGRTKEEREEDEQAMEASIFGGDDDPFGQGVWTVSGLVASVNTSWSLPLADVDHPWDGEAARKRVWDWAGEDYRRYRRAFLWYDSARPEQKNSYKLPIADVIDGELKIVPRAVNAVAAVLGGARGGVDIPDEDMDTVARVVERLQRKFQTSSETAAMWGESAGYGVPEDDDCPEGQHEMPDGTCMSDEEMEAMEASAAPVYPPASAFQYNANEVNGPTPFTVTADGRAFGHLWLWNRCHAGIVDECVMAPRTVTNYQYFHNGQVMTSDGKLVKVGKITMGTGHAGPNMRWIPAADHYDNTGTAAAIVRVTDDSYGGYANGFLVSSLSDEQVQELRRSPISGDWRRINGNLELVAALAVNIPGFPIVASINGEAQSLVAAGMILTDDQGEILAAVESDEKLTQVEKDLTAQVDELDSKLTELALKGRTRKWGQMMAALDERKR